MRETVGRVLEGVAVYHMVCAMVYYMVCFMR